ncbi:MAG: glycoside hydrolase, partial [Candidatus Dormibacteraeota bacterium]|nr:glycoside hydrolase [Candidatus Dormibacteraeota bacterium]
MAAKVTGARALMAAMLIAALLGPASPALSQAPAVRVSANYRLGDDVRPARGHDIPVVQADPTNPRHLVEFDFDYVNESCDANVSLDGGATWTGSVLSGPAGFKAPFCHINNNHRGGRAAHSSIAFGSGANVYTTFASESAEEADSIGVVRSSDGGRSFAPSVVAIAAVAPDAGAPGTDFRRPQLAVSADPAGDHVYVAGWNCTLSAAPPPANHRPGRCASVAFSSSSDGAKTFSAPVTVNTPDPLDLNFDNS